MDSNSIDSGNDTRTSCGVVDFKDDELMQKLLVDEDYDTDLEEEKNKNKKKLDIHEIRKNMYKRKCQELGASPIQSYLRKQPERQLKLPYRCMSARDANALTYCLELNSEYSDLNLAGNGMGPTAFSYVSCLLWQNVHFTKLNVSGNKLGREGMKLLKSILLNNHTITNLNVSDNDFDDTSGEDWKEILMKNDEISNLNISHNKLSAKGALDIADGLVRNESVMALDLSWNSIRLQGAVGIGKVLRANKTLRELYLQFNGFGDRGCLEVAASLLENKSLRILDISANRLWRDSTVPFSNLFRKNKKLRVLKIRTNPILCEGATVILKALLDVKGAGLEYLDIRDITVTEEFIRLYRQLQAIKPKFKINIRNIIKSDGNVERLKDDINDENPLEVLLMFMQEKNLRLIDLFKNLDKDQSNAISRDEFVLGMRDIEVPLSESQIDNLIEILDKDGDGEIDLQEIMNINHEFKDIKRRAIRRVREKKATARLRGAEFAAMAINRLTRMGTEVDKKNPQGEDDVVQESLYIIEEDETKKEPEGFTQQSPKSQLAPGTVQKQLPPSLIRSRSTMMPQNTLRLLSKRSSIIPTDMTSTLLPGMKEFQKSAAAQRALRRPSTAITQQKKTWFPTRNVTNINK